VHPPRGAPHPAVESRRGIFEATTAQHPKDMRGLDRIKPAQVILSDA